MFKKFFKSKLKTKQTNEPKGKFEIINIIYEDGQVKLETDWDDEFIEYLRSNGFTGNENQIIQKYLVLLNKQILQHIGEIPSDEFV